MSSTRTIPGVYELKWPESVSVPLLLDSPHSGRHYPDNFNYVCKKEELEKVVDYYVEALFDNIHEIGVPFLHAFFPRSYIDVNRAPDDIDTELVENAKVLKPKPSSRAQAGIGLIQRLIRPEVQIYGGNITPAEVQSRIRNYYNPYHHCLQEGLDHLYYEYGQVWHINCHSMPSTTTRIMDQIYTTGKDHKMVDFVLGDRDGTTCSREFLEIIYAFLKSKGFTVDVNNPYKGVEITRRHGRPGLNRHSLQLEINRALYMNERTLEKTAGFDSLKTEVKDLIAHCQEYISEKLVPLAAD